MLGLQNTNSIRNDLPWASVVVITGAARVPGSAYCSLAQLHPGSVMYISPLEIA